MHTIPLKSQPYTIKDRTNLSRVLSEATKDLFDHVEMLNLQGSGFSMTQALSVDIQISRVLGVRHGCQMIPFSKTQRAIKSIRSHQHLVQLENTGDNCFLASVAYHFIKDTCPTPLDASCDDYSKFYSTLNLEGITFNESVDLSQMKAFVRQNPSLDINLNILAMDKQTVYAYATGIGRSSAKNNINLLSIPLTSPDEPCEGMKIIYTHLVPINNIERFLTHIYQKKDGARQETYYYRKYWCMKCLEGYNSKAGLEEHKYLCSNKKSQVYTFFLLHIACDISLCFLFFVCIQVDRLPQEGDTLFFKNYLNRFPKSIIGCKYQLIHFFVKKVIFYILFFSDYDFETAQIPNKDNPEVKVHKPIQYR